MGSVTIIVIIPLFILYVLGSSIVGIFTGGDKTEVVLPYEPENGIIWECDIPLGYLELVETEIDGETQVFTFKGNMLEQLWDLYETETRTDGEVYKIIFTDRNENELVYYAKSDEDSKYPNKMNIYAPGEYFTFDYTVKAERDGGEGYSWHYIAFSDQLECTVVTPSPEKTYTIVLTEGYENGETNIIKFKYSNEFDAPPYETLQYTYEEYKVINGEVVFLEEKEYPY